MNWWLPGLNFWFNSSSALCMRELEVRKPGSVSHLEGSRSGKRHGLLRIFSLWCFWCFVCFPQRLQKTLPLGINLSTWPRFTWGWWTSGLLASGGLILFAGMGGEPEEGPGLFGASSSGSVISYQSCTCFCQILMRMDWICLIWASEISKLVGTIEVNWKQTGRRFNRRGKYCHMGCLMSW